MTAPLDAALDLAARFGLRVFPLSGKAPAIAGGRGHLDASSDPDEIHELWRRARRVTGFGINIAESGLFVVDLDEGHVGRNTLDRLCEQHGALGAPLEVITGSGNTHLYFAHADGVRTTVRELGPGLDTKSAGYCAAPPSRHPNTGRPYVWIHGPALPPPPPGWLVGLLRRPSRPSRPPTVLNPAGLSAYAMAAVECEVQAVLDAPQGRRNDQLNVSSYNLGQLVGAGLLDESVVVKALTLAGIATGLDFCPCHDSRPRCEVVHTLHSGLDAGKANPRRVAS